MSEAVVVILDIAKHLAAARRQNMSGQLFRGCFASASRDGDDRLVPFKINAMRQALKRRYRVFKRISNGPLYCSSSARCSSNLSSRTTAAAAPFSNCRGHVFGRILEISVESVVRVIGLRESKKTSPRLTSRESIAKEPTSRVGKAGSESGRGCIHISNGGFKFQVSFRRSVPGLACEIVCL